MRSHEVLKTLRQFESRNVTFLDPDGTWPIVWARAKGCHVWDAEGRRYLDLTAAFGVAAAGHANPRVVRAGQRQMATLLHAMGDVHPHALKAQLARELSELTFGRWSSNSAFRIPHSAFGKAIFCNSGFEAVEAALKTARLATGKPGVIAFEGGYHGLGYGALNATHRDHFRGPFRNQLREFARFLPFPPEAEAIPSGQERGSLSCKSDRPHDGRLGEPRSRCMATLERELRTAFRHHSIGAVLVEPVQARGGIRIPPPEFLPLLRRLADEHGALLILDEIYTGFGRTGAWFACEHSHVAPDLICLGKALTGGFPLSACVGRADVMDAAWPPSTGEAIHTSTFLGHPVGCAMALAQIAELKARHLIERSVELGAGLADELVSKFKVQSSKFKVAVRTIGLMTGLELRHADDSPASAEALAIIKRLLQRGFILLPEGEHGNVISLTPPLTITRRQLQQTLDALRAEITASFPPGQDLPAAATNRKS